MKSLDKKLNETLGELAKEELKLFHSYNRHATSEIKLRVLTDLQKVILQQEILKKLKG